jgi:hypothetical protein
MPYKYTGRFETKYGKLPENIRQKVKKALRLLDVNYRHPGLRSHPVISAPGVYEAYVDKQYRMTYERRGDTFVLRNIDNHDECLRNP